MTTASASGEVRTSQAVVRGVLADLAGWSWVPGVAAITVHSATEADWRIDTPAGPAHVPLVFSFDDDGVSFDMRADATGPFARVAGRVDATARQGDGGGAGTVTRFELTLDGSPPPPLPLAAMVAEGAVAGLARRLVNERPSAPEPELIAVPMTDGVHLAVHHYRTPSTPAPVVVFVTPYRKEGAFMRELARVITGAGFHFLVGDVRGIGGSIASYEGLLSEREVTDYAELVEWCADQPWSDGQVATMGASYCGANQLLVAARKPRGLRCIAPFVGPVDTYRDWTHRGGIPTHALWGAMTYLNSQHVDTFRRGVEQYYLDFMADPFDNERHRARSPESVLGNVDVPALIVGGWHDYFLRSTVRTFLGVAGPKRLVIGPWGHGDFSPRQEDELTTWLEWWLHGTGEDPTGGRNVQLYVTGAEEWVERESWPDPATAEWVEVAVPESEVQVHTHLMAVMPAPNPKRQFMPDPTDSGFGLWGEAWTHDAAPFDDAVHVEGPLGLTVALRVGDDACDDVNVHARVSAVRADGSVVQLTEGRLRASQRAVDLSRSRCAADGRPIVPWHPHDRAEPLVAGADTELVIEVYPISHRFAPGDRVRLGLTLTRADEGAVPVAATITSATRLLLPLAHS